MDKKSILIGALGASLLFVSIGAGINSSENAHESHKWVFSPDSKSTLNVKTGEWRIHDVIIACEIDSLGNKITSTQEKIEGYFVNRDMNKEAKTRGLEIMYAGYRK